MQNYCVTGGMYKEHRFCWNELPRLGERPAEGQKEEEKGKTKKEEEKQNGEKAKAVAAKGKEFDTKKATNERVQQADDEEIRELEKEITELRKKKLEGLRREKVALERELGEAKTAPVEEKSPQTKEAAAKPEQGNKNTPTEKAEAKNDDSWSTETLYKLLHKNLEKAKSNSNQWLQYEGSMNNTECAYVPEQKRLYFRQTDGRYSYMQNPDNVRVENYRWSTIDFYFLKDLPNVGGKMHDAIYVQDINAPLETSVLWRKRRETAIKELKPNTWGPLSNGHRGYDYALHVPEGKTKEQGQLFYRNGLGEHFCLEEDYSTWDYRLSGNIPNFEGRPSIQVAGFSPTFFEEALFGDISREQRKAWNDNLIEGLSQAHNQPGKFFRSKNSEKEYYFYHDNNYYKYSQWPPQTISVFVMADSKWKDLSHHHYKYKEIYDVYGNTLEQIRQDLNLRSGGEEKY